MVLVEFTGHVQEAGAAFKNGHRSTVVLDVHDSGHAVVGIDRREPFGLMLCRENLQVDEVVRNPARVLVKFAIAW